MNSAVAFKNVTRARCPGCNSHSISVIKRIELSNTALSSFLHEYYEGRFPLERLGDWNYVLACCDDCGLLFQQQVLDDAGLEYLYEQAVDQSHSLAKREQGNADSFLRRLKSASRVFWFYPNKKPRKIRVLDFGMGWGHWCVAASALGLDSYGAELSKTRIVFAKNMGVRVLDDLEKHEERFHFINTEQSLEHVVELRSTIELLVRLLRPGGVLRVSVPDGSNMAEALASKNWKPSKDALHPLEHVNAFSFQSLTALLRTVGLRPVTWKDVHGTRATVSALRKHMFRRNQPTWFFKKE